MSIGVRAGFWFGFYLLLIAFPLVVGAIWWAGAGGRPFLVQFGVGCGYEAFATMAFESRRFNPSQPPSGSMPFQFHRQIGLVSAVIVLAHAALMIVSGY